MSIIRRRPVQIYF